MSAVNNLSAAKMPRSVPISGAAQSNTLSGPAETESEAGIGFRSKGSQADVNRATVKKIDIDGETQTVIFQTIDEQTDAVVSQYPSEALLNLRTYLTTLGSSIVQPGSFNRIV